MKALFILLLACNITYAENYESSTSFLEINDNNIILNDVEYNLSKEHVVDAYAVGTSSLMGGSSTACRISIRRAKQQEDGSIVLLYANMSKRSQSQGLLCWASKNSNSFGKPFYYEYIKLDFSQEGSDVEVTKLTVIDGIGRPRFSIAQLLNSNLLDNKDLISYGEQSPSRVRVETELLKIENN
jgi:hypothetical protein